MQKVLVIVAAGMLLSGCETLGNVQHDMNPRSAIARHATFDLAFSAPVEDDMVLLRKEVAAALVGNQVFKYQESENPDYLIEMRFLEVHKVSGIERVLDWILAGRNEVTAQIKVIDGSGEAIRSFKASGKSAAHPLSGANDFADAVRVFAIQVVKGIAAK